MHKITTKPLIKNVLDWMTFTSILNTKSYRMIITPKMFKSVSVGHFRITFTGNRSKRDKR